MKDINNKIDELIKVIQEAEKEAQQEALNNLLPRYLKRIFNDGLGTENVQIGNYSTKTKVKFNRPDFDALNDLAKGRTKGDVDKTVTYIELRIKAGRQVAYVDLQFTDRLFHSIVVEEYNERWVLGFNDPERADIARENEIRFKKAIFEPSEEEIKLAREIYVEVMQEKIQNLFNTWR